MEFIEKQKIAQEQSRIQKIGAAGLWSIFVNTKFKYYLFIYCICNQFVCIVYKFGIYASKFTVLFYKNNNKFVTPKNKCLSNYRNGMILNNIIQNVYVKLVHVANINALNIRYILYLL